MEASDKIERYILNRKKVFLELQDLKRAYENYSWTEIVQAVLELEAKGHLQPVKSSDVMTVSGKTIHVKWKTIAQSEDISWLYHLDPPIPSSRYARDNAKLLFPYREDLESLTKWRQRGGALNPATCRERSLEIFGDEKALQDKVEGPSGLAALLRKVGYTDDVLGIVRSPQTFEVCLRRSYVLEGVRDDLPTLVIENRDPWLRVRESLRHDRDVLGCRIGAAVYGAGNVITSNSGEDLIDTLATFAIDTAPLLYWGDIDRAGIAIAMSLQGGIPDRISPFYPAYEAMLSWSLLHTPVPSKDSSTKLTKQMLEWLDSNSMEPTLAEQYRDVLSRRERIPQECLTNLDTQGS